MSPINNLKKIREIYGATQEQIAQALNVNRVTVTNWENGSSMPSRVNREKLSLYYGISPDFFFDKELSEPAKQLIIDTAEKERTVVSNSKGQKNKQEDFHRTFEEIRFNDTLNKYLLYAKLMIAKADDADLDTLRTALTVHQKLGRRLEALIRIREEEEA